MNFSFYMPVKIFTGKNCILNNAQELKTLGNSALVVTYPISRENGSLDDVVNALKTQDIECLVYEKALVNQILKL